MRFLLIFVVTIGMSFLFGFVAVEVLGLIATIRDRKRSLILSDVLTRKPGVLAGLASIIVFIPFWVTGSNTFFLNHLMIPTMVFVRSQKGVEQLSSRIGSWFAEDKDLSS